MSPHGIPRALVCALLLAGAMSAQPTFTRDVSRIVQAKCGQCHRPNDVAPFALQTYDDVVTYSDDIRAALTNKRMPPWKPVPGFGEFKDSYALSDGDRQLIFDWMDAGMPQGDAADAPDPLPVSDSPWQLGPPDLVMTMPEYTPPRRPDTYRCFSLDPALDVRKYLSAAEAIPGNRAEVHHILLFVDDSNESAALDGVDGQPGYDCFGGPGLANLSVGSMVGAWVPGSRIRRLDEGIGLRIPANSRIVMQVHYHPAGRSTPDKTQVGFYFAPTDSIKHRLLSVPILNTSFKIPPGEASYEVKASFTVPFFAAGKVIMAGPHMHLLGRKIKVEIAETDGSTTPLIAIDDWDFNWQGYYTLANAVDLKPGATVRLSAVYDNSENNPRNPNNPLKAVGWGEGTEDEMCLAFIGVILDNDALAELLRLSR